MVEALVLVPVSEIYVINKCKLFFFLQKPIKNCANHLRLSEKNDSKGHVI